MTESKIAKLGDRVRTPPSIAVRHGRHGTDRGVPTGAEVDVRVRVLQPRARRGEEGRSSIRPGGRGDERSRGSGGGGEGPRRVLRGHEPTTEFSDFRGKLAGLTSVTRKYFDTLVTE